MTMANVFSKGLFGLRGGGEGGVGMSKVKLVENMLILGQLYSTLLYFIFLPLNPNVEREILRTSYHINTALLHPNLCQHIIILVII